MKRVLAIELRRSPVLLFAPWLLAFDLGMLLATRDSRYWAGDWHATSLAIAFPVLVLAPALAACAAWVAGRGRRQGFAILDAVMPRPARHASIVQWAVVAGVGVGIYLLGAVVAGVRTAAEAKAGHIWLSYVLVGAVSLLAYSAVGYCAGRLVSSRFTAPICGLAVFGWLVALSTTSPRWQRLALTATDPLLTSPALAARPVVVGARVLLAGAVLVCAAALVGAGRGGGRARVVRVTAPIAGLAAVGLVVVGFGGDNLTPRGAPTAGYCQGSAPRVCLWPEHAKWADDAVDVAGRLAVALQGVATLPPVINEAGLGGTPTEPAGVPAIVINTVPVTRGSLITGLVAGIAPTPPPACMLASGSQRFDSERFERYLLVGAWLTYQGSGSVTDNIRPDPERFAELLRASPDRQRSWIRDNIPLVRACDQPVIGPSGP